MSARFAYLETQVFTASPPQLRLLLIQAALRTAEKSLQRWTAPLPEEVSHALTQLRRMLAQLLTSLGAGENELERNLQSVYLYLFQAVTQAQLSGDAEKIRDVVRVLEVEHETWRVLAERYASRRVDDQTLQSSPGDQECKTVPPAAGLYLEA